MEDERHIQHIRSHVAWCGALAAVRGDDDIDLALGREGGGQRMSEAYKAPWLGSLPLAMAIRAQSDAGEPIVAADPASAASGIYREIARKLAARVSTLPRDLSDKFGVIQVKRT